MPGSTNPLPEPILTFLSEGSPRTNLVYINSSPPGQNDRHLADDVLKCIFVNENFCILIIFH